MADVKSKLGVYLTEETEHGFLQLLFELKTNQRLPATKTSVVEEALKHVIADYKGKGSDSLIVELLRGAK